VRAWSILQNATGNVTINTCSLGQRKSPNKQTPLRSRLSDIQSGHQRSSALTLRNPIHNEGITLRPVSFPLTPDHLLNLVHHNVQRAFLTNMLILGIPSIMGCHNLAPGEGKRVFALPATVTTVPPSLAPTGLQRSTPHKPWIDVFPVPALRDALITAEARIAHWEMCADLVGLATEVVDDDGNRIPVAPDERRGLVVWGEPWDVGAWEVTEGFARTWGWLLREGCGELKRATDRWRAARGEEGMDWDGIGVVFEEDEE
jgi:hypothetical protein